jgi:Na+-driven multidrug efflux pump
MVSNIIGQGMQHRVIELILKIMKLSFGFSFCVVLLLNLAPGLPMHMYEQGQDFISDAIPVVRVVSVAMLFMSCAAIWLNAVIGTGNTRVNLAIEIFAITVYSIYIYIVLEKLNLSTAMGWTSEWVYWTFIFIPSVLYVKSGKWMHKKI